jgi:folate-dependent phosphoribosylglycinamide formyltransferase PurN
MVPRLQAPQAVMSDKTPLPNGIVAVTAGGPYAWIIFNALAEAFGPITVIEEQPEPKSLFLRRRLRKFGFIETFGQFAMMTATRIGKAAAKKRTAQIIANYGLYPEPGPLLTRTAVGSINDAATHDLLAGLQPKVLFLAGCRLLSPATLAAAKCPVINYHAGICPAYRGLNGGYFALVENDRQNFGSTVHLVDSGVDTGGILYQQRIVPAGNDSFFTYAMLMAAESRGIAVQGVRDALAGSLQPVTVDLPSRQWFHPTLWGYLWTGFRTGVW